MKGKLILLIINIIKSITIIYDVITFPLYYLIQNPNSVLNDSNRVRARRENICDLQSPYLRVGPKPKHYVNECKTIVELQKRSLLMNGRDRHAIGYRRILAEEEEKQPNGQIMSKSTLSDYQWLSIGEVDEIIGEISRGLAVNGVKHRDNVFIFAETRFEWFLSAQSILRIGATFTTISVSVGEEGLVEAINETQVRIIITTQELIHRILKINSRIPIVNTIVYIEGLKPIVSNEFNSDINLISLKRLIELGKSSSKAVTCAEPTEEDRAVIYYTSGTTGNPKGVVLSHKNFMSCITSLMSALNDEVLLEIEMHTYIAYLPLTHGLEFMFELFMFGTGVKIGYSSVNTLTDQGSAVRRGEKADIVLLKPTILAAVPLVLDKISESIVHKIESRGEFAKHFFRYIIDYKHLWERRGFSTPVVNQLFCPYIRKHVGSKLQYIIVGGAPLSPDTHRVLKSALNINLLQGFGATELCGAVTLMDRHDMSLGRVGAPLFGVRIKLVDWEEGGYRVTDRPNSRGELVIGGNNISKGYYKLDEQTEEVFEYTDGIQWFQTGDIGEVDERGVFRIIDRKKDLIKLQNGIYISLAKVETVFRKCHFVDNICVCVNSFHTYIVALIVPNIKAIHLLAQELDIKVFDKPYNELYNNEKLLTEILKEMKKFGLESGLNKIEIPAQIKLCSEDWVLNGFLTAAFKLRRKYIKSYYQTDIDRMYCHKNK